MMEYLEPPQFMLCLTVGHNSVSLERGKLYRLVKPYNNDPPEYVRIFDETHDDYLFPASWFAPVDVPPDAVKALVVEEQGAEASAIDLEDYAVCIYDKQARNRLIRRVVYRVVDDSEAEERGQVVVEDESGDPHPYPIEWFIFVGVQPEKAEELRPGIRETKLATVLG